MISRAGGKEERADYGCNLWKHLALLVVPYCPNVSYLLGPTLTFSFSSFPFLPFPSPTLRALDHIAKEELACLEPRQPGKGLAGRAAAPRGAGEAGGAATVRWEWGQGGKEKGGGW